DSPPYAHQRVRALAAYRNAIAIDPASKEARAGLTALLDVGATRLGDADALAQAVRVHGALRGGAGPGSPAQRRSRRRARPLAGASRRGARRSHAARAAPRGRAAPPRAQ